VSVQHFLNRDGPKIVGALVQTIQEHRAYLSELDGAIGDGDHGINMSKGFALAGQQLGSAGYALSEGLDTLGMTLMMEVGGAMGPLYGTLFIEMASACQDHEEIDARLFGTMLQAARDAVASLGNAQVGDKTLMDTLIPAVEAYHKALDRGADFGEALVEMSKAAEAGKESTRDLVAQVGRASRLGERSRGHLDAGATSCWLVLRAMAETIQPLLVP
jgi:dihydroxyacetone kinase-like protein